jgi:FkbM family methyltransferase
MFLGCTFRSVASHSLVPEFLPPNAIVVDAGANVGEFSIAMADTFHCQCLAIEPSRAVFERIPSDESVRKFCFALAGSAGVVDLHVGVNSVSTAMHRTQSTAYSATIRASAQTLDEFRDSMKLDHIDLLKMDIEGEELAVLDSCSADSLRSIGQITVEFHEWIGLGTPADVRRVIRRMQGLGFYAFNMSRTNYSDVLFVNGRYMSPARFAVAWVANWVPRLFRSLLRRLGAGRRAD